MQTLRKNAAWFPCSSTVLSLAATDHMEVPKVSTLSGVVFSGKAARSKFTLVIKNKNKKRQSVCHNMLYLLSRLYQ